MWETDKSVSAVGMLPIPTVETVVYLAYHQHSICPLTHCFNSGQRHQRVYQDRFIGFSHAYINPLQSLLIVAPKAKRHCPESVIVHPRHRCKEEPSGLKYPMSGRL